MFGLTAVAIKKAPIMMCHYEDHPIPIVLDTGAEHNVISDTVVGRLSINILRTSSQAVQVDKSPLRSVGCISIMLTNGGDSWLFDAIVCTNIGDVVIAGNPFLAQGINPITYRNITEIVANDGSIRTIPWRPEQKLPAKPIQLPSSPAKCGPSQQSFCLGEANRSHQTTPENLIKHSMQTQAIPFANLSMPTNSNDEKLVPDSCGIAAATSLQAEVDRLGKEVTELVFQNNRYHLAVSDCTFCALDDANTADASSFDASIRAPTSVSFASPSSGQNQALLRKTIPALMSLKIENRRKAEVNTVKNSKDTTFISRMVNTLANLETKYLGPRLKKKRRQFTKKQNTSPMAPKRRASSVYHGLSAPEPEKLTFPELFPHVKCNTEEFKTALSYPNSCPFPVHSFSPYHEFYADCIHHDAVGGRERRLQGGLRGRRDRKRRGAPDS